MTTQPDMFQTSEVSGKNFVGKIYLLSGNAVVQEPRETSEVYGAIVVAISRSCLND